MRRFSLGRCGLFFSLYDIIYSSEHRVPLFENHTVGRLWVEEVSLFESAVVPQCRCNAASKCTGVCFSTAIYMARSRCPATAWTRVPTPNDSRIGKALNGVHGMRPLLGVGTLFAVEMFTSSCVCVCVLCLCACSVCVLCLCACGFMLQLQNGYICRVRITQCLKAKNEEMLVRQFLPLFRIWFFSRVFERVCCRQKLEWNIKESRHSLLLASTG